MTIRFACPCGQELEAEPGHAGMETVCPQCRRDLTIPAAPPPVPTAVRPQATAAARPRPPLTNRYNDDGTIARRKRDSDDEDDDSPRRERHFDDHDAHADEDEDTSRRPRMRRPGRPDEPTGINWPLVGGSALVMLITGPWAALVIFGGGIPVYPTIGFIAGTVGVVRGLLGHRQG
jgi:hypothetical protein